MNSRSRNILLHSASLLLIITAFAGLFLLNSDWTHNGRFWQSWYPLLIPENQMNSELESEIQKLGGGNVISKSETFLEYSDYKNLEQISLEDFSAGKGPYQDDPRIDPYMIGLQSYFNQDIYEILYLPSSKSPLEYQRLFLDSSLMSETNWLLPDWRSNSVYILLFVSVLLLLCLGSMRFCVTAAAFAAAGYIAYAGGQSSVLLVLAVTALFLRVSDLRKGRIAWQFVLPFLPTAAAFFMGLFQIRQLELISLVFLVFAGVALWPERLHRQKTNLNLKKRKSRRAGDGKDHSLFDPVSLFEKQRAVQVSVKERPSFLLLTAAVMSLFLCFLNLTGEKKLPVGIPAVERAEGLWDYEGLLHSQTSDQMPGALDYMKHMAYQESFIYGGTYSLPIPGSVISIEDYHLTDGRIFESKPSVLIFTDLWYESRLSQMGTNGPGKLLASESSPPVISPRYSETFGISLQMLLVFVVFIFVFVLIHLSGTHHASEFSGIRSSGKFVFRRKQQAA